METLTSRTIKGYDRHPDFETALSDIEAADICRKSDDPFARDLARKFDANRIKGKQWYWLFRKAEMIENPPAQTETESVELPNIATLFHNAKMRGAKRARIEITSPDETTVRFSLAGARSKAPGSINVTDGRPYGSNTWYGRITNGEWKPRNATDNVRKVVEEFEADPVAYGAAYGKRTGSCCFCSRLLTDPRSTEVGYGPVCADKYGLLWGA